MTRKKVYDIKVFEYSFKILLFMSGKHYGSLVEVYRGNLWEAELVKGLLNANLVDSMIKDETPSALTSPYNSPEKGVLVLVNQEEIVYAERLIHENVKDR